MVKSSLAIVGMLCLACIGCQVDRSHYPPIDDGTDVGAAPAPLADHRPMDTGTVREVEENAPPAENESAPEPGKAPPTPPAAPAADDKPTVNTAPVAKAQLSKLYGLAVRASHVVYVVDRGASTNKYWDDLRTEIIGSIGDLYLEQDFTVILMGDAKPRQGPVAGLIAAAKRNQTHAAKMLLETDAAGKTNPLAALRLAVATLAKADNKPGKVIYLITDRAMMDEAATKLVPRGIVVMTYLIGEGGDDSRQVLEKLARDSGGRFTHVASPAAE